MKKWIHASKDYTKAECSNVNASTSFDAWYDSLSSADQEKVDDLADNMGLPLYGECSEAELAQLHDSFVSNKGDANVYGSDDFLTPEQKEALRNADTSGWAQMQTEYMEDEIRNAGSYGKYIEEERKWNRR